EPLRQPSRELIEKLDALEAKLHNPKAQVTYDILAMRGGAQLYSKYGPLFEWAKDADGAPTEGIRSVYEELARELRQHETDLNDLIARDLAQLNALAYKLQMPAVVVPDLDDSYQPGAEGQKQPGVPEGKVTQYRWESKIFPGTARDYWVYVPAQY